MQTIEEKAKDYIKRTCVKNCRFELDCRVHGDFFSQSDIHTNCRKRYQAYRDGIKDATQWIDIEDELPKIGMEVLIKFNNGVIIASKISSMANYKDVISWRPIEYK